MGGSGAKAANAIGLLPHDADEPLRTPRGKLKTRAEVESLCLCAFYQFHVKVPLRQIPKWVALDAVVSDLEVEMGAC